MSAKQLTLVEGVLAIAAVVAVGVGLGVTRKHLVTDDAAASPVMAKSTDICVLSVRGTQQGPVVFPTKEGAQEFDAALTTKPLDPDLVNRVMRLNRGFQATHNAGCLRIEEGFSHSKVRVLDGAGADEVGWLPTSQTRGN